MMYIINSILLVYILTSISIIGLVRLFDLNKVYNKLNSQEYENCCITNLHYSDEESYNDNYDNEAVNVINL